MNPIKRFLLLSFLSAASLIHALDYVSDPQDAGSLTVDGTSNIHDWAMTTSTLNGTAEIKGGKVVSLKAEVPVEELKSDKKKLDKNAYKALDTDKFEKVSFEQTGPLEAAPEGSGHGHLMPGKLTIRGVEKEIKVGLDLKPGKEGAMVLSGLAELNMEDWGIDPPTALMGMARTRPVVKIRFTWNLIPAGQNP